MTPFIAFKISVLLLEGRLECYGDYAAWDFSEKYARQVIANFHEVNCACDLLGIATFFDTRFMDHIIKWELTDESLPILEQL